MRKIISCIDFADGGDGLIQFTEFILAGCSKKTLLSQENIIKEFSYLDMDKDGVIAYEDIRKFMMSFSDSEQTMQENFLEDMLSEIIQIYTKKQPPDAGGAQTTTENGS